MKWLTLLAFFGAIPYYSTAQTRQKENIIYLDDNGQQVKEKKASFVEQVIQFNDTLWEYNFYRKNGPRITSIRSSDADGKVWNGRYVAYSPFGRPDTIGNYTQGLRSGEWSYFTPMGRLLELRFYKNGMLYWTKDSVTAKHEADSAKAARDSLRSPSDTDAAFTGGAAGWLHYLNKSLRYPDEAVNNEIRGTCIVSFLVDTAGHVPEVDAWIYRSVCLSIDQEAFRIMVNSPAWTPAFYKGRLAKSYKRQPIVFSLERH
jgi:hypothetical protein